MQTLPLQKLIGDITADCGACGRFNTEEIHLFLPIEAIHQWKLLVFNRSIYTTNSTQKSVELQSFENNRSSGIPPLSPLVDLNPTQSQYVLWVIFKRWKQPYCSIKVGHPSIHIASLYLSPYTHIPNQDLEISDPKIYQNL
ncbi:hypothetical protein L6452_12828 [Arctium lappa]|uniref:Uncharacterized protein n=1 Tax=Arctium lappa TaxID=4217 RepID=A0ACB9CGS9_ARCLA|nr:hypothetical protein L6452_12828 [Arctium lappa]